MMQHYQQEETNLGYKRRFLSRRALCMSYSVSQELDQRIGVPVQPSQGALVRLSADCERAKVALSSSTVVDVNVKSIFPGLDFHSSISRLTFEDINQASFDRCLDLVGQVKCFSPSSFIQYCTQVAPCVLCLGGTVRIP